MIELKVMTSAGEYSVKLIEKLIQNKYDGFELDITLISPVGKYTLYSGVSWLIITDYGNLVCPPMHRLSKSDPIWDEIRSGVEQEFLKYLALNF